MGLGFNFGDAHWSYSSFNNFRHKIADYVGIKLDDMEGYGGNIKWNTIDDDITILLNHSDCDGYLTPKKCERLITRLQKILDEWNNMYEHDNINAKELINGMKIAVEKNKRFIFC